MTALPRIAFVHIPKTAGTSVREVFTRLYGEAAFPGMTTLDYPHYSNEMLLKYRFYSGHAYRRDFSRLPGDTLSFTVLRNPVSRAISLYRYFRAIEPPAEDRYTCEAIEIAKTAGIVEFIYSHHPVIVEHLRAGQLRQFVDGVLLDDLGHRTSMSAELERQIWASFTEAVSAFPYVFTVDWLDISLRMMMREIGLDADAVPHANVSTGEYTVDEFAVRRAVYDVSPLDCRAYDYARMREQQFLWTRLRASGAETRAGVATLGAGG